MHIPSREEFVAACQLGNLVPVYREILADGDTPVSAYAKLGQSDYSFLLESVVGGEKWAAYSFVGVSPRVVLTCRGGTAHAIWHDVDGGGAPREASWPAPDPTAALAEVMSEWKPVDIAGLPRFWGGAVGWVAYDVVRAFEDLPARAPRALDLPELCFVVTDTLVIFDNLRQTIKVVAAPYIPRPEKAEAAYERAMERIDEVIDRLRRPSPGLRLIEPPRAEATEVKVPASSFPKPAFLEAVERIREYILAGDIFQAVLSQRFTVPRQGVDDFDVYRALRVVNPSPYMFHLQFPEARVTGASPETLVRLSDGRVEVRPIAGTRHRGDTPEQDEALEVELLADAKECAEHLMLVDLGRNDVGRVSEMGTVRATELMRVERYSHVMHIVSAVHGEVRAGATWHDVLRAAFPAGTLSGAPKIRAMEIIDELEPHSRGIYGGAVGYVSFGGNMDLAIAIRTLVGLEDEIHIQAGAGIVADSDPEREFEETCNKARAVIRAVELAKRDMVRDDAEPDEDTP